MKNDMSIRDIGIKCVKLLIPPHFCSVRISLYFVQNYCLNF